MVSLDAFKGIALGSLFLIALLGGLSPIVSAPSRQRHDGGKDGGSRALPVMNVASAGVFIAAGLMHLLADAIANDELSERSEEFWGDEGGSLTALSLCLAGFLLLVVVEQAVNVCRRRCASSATATLDGKVPLRDALDSEDIQTLEAGAGNVASSLTVAVVVALGLSLHSVMEGLALGAQEEQEAAIGIFVAILAHKGIAAFALGNKVFQSVQLGGGGQMLWFVLAMLLFAAMTPIGIAIGWAVTRIGDPEENPWPAAFSALGAGTFLFVATVEVIPGELGHNCSDPGMKTTALCVGAVLMGMLARWA